MQIQWYPGHMAKAKRELTEDLRLIDVVVELVDARAPRATRNPDFDALFAGKERVVLLNKSDLADPSVSARWTARFRSEGLLAAEIVSSSNACRKAAVQLIERASAPRVEKAREKGVAKVVRAIIVGIPNVGKSTFINRIAGDNRTKTGDKPGVTRAKQWVKITPHMELLDTPGLLWPKLEDQACAKHLAYIGSVRDEIMDAEELAAELLTEIAAIAPGKLAARYPKIEAGMTGIELLEAVARSRGFLVSCGEPDADRAARIALDEFRAGKIGRISLERPE